MNVARQLYAMNLHSGGKINMGDIVAWLVYLYPYQFQCNYVTTNLKSKNKGLLALKLKELNPLLQAR